MDFTSLAFWGALGSIIWVNIVLSGDNAVVIALAARSLPPAQQKQAVFWGSAAAIVLRIVLTVIALEMLKWPYLKLVGGCLLFYIGVSLLLEEDEDGHEGGLKGEGGGLMAAVRTILVADLVMSLDNVLAVAAAANGNVPLLVIGLALSVPLIIFGSTLLLKVIERYPLLVTLGAALLGFLAGEMLLTDPVIERYLGAAISSTWVHVGGAVGAVAVVLVGTFMQKRRSK